MEGVNTNVTDLFVNYSEFTLNSEGKAVNPTWHRHELWELKLFVIPHISTLEPCVRKTGWDFCRYLTKRSMGWLDSPRQVRATIVTKGEFQDQLEQSLCNEFSSRFIENGQICHKAPSIPSVIIKCWLQQLQETDSKSTHNHLSWNLKLCCMKMPHNITFPWPWQPCYTICSHHCIPVADAYTPIALPPLLPYQMKD